MITATRPGSSRPHARLAALSILLALALVLSAILAWQAVASARQQRVTAERTLADYADFAAFVLATGVYREYGINVLAAFGALPPWNTPSLFDASGVASGCGGDRLYFEYEPATGSLRRSPAPLTQVAESHLRDTLGLAPSLFNEASWRFRLIRLDLAGAGNAVFTVPVSLPDGFGVRGMSSCLWGDSTSVRLTRRWSALPPSLTGSLPPDSLYAVAIGDTMGVELYHSPVRYGGAFRGGALLGPEFGDLTLAVALNPAIAPDLVIGGLPPSRTPLALGLFALSALLLLAAALLLRREYRLIVVRSEFVSSVSHELRTPLSQILIFTELLKLGRLRSDEERKRSLDIIDKETRRLIRLVENVLQFSRSASQPEPAADNLAILAVVEETIDAFRPLAEARAVTVIVEGPDVRARANRNAVRQILLNLLDNAVKYGPHGQTVRVEVGTRNGDVELAVEDQGPGVPATARDKIWDGFERLERDTLSSVSGSGIGLSVVRSLADRMGGRVSVTDSATGGARFIVYLPAGIAEP